MNKRYAHLLEPLQIRGFTLKNRLMASKFSPHYSSFSYDTEFFTRVANNGAAVVTIGPGAYPGRELERYPDGGPARYPSKVDLTNQQVRKEYAGMIEKIHSCGSLVTVIMMEIEPILISISDFDEYEELMKQGEYVQSMIFRKREATSQELERLTDELAWRALDAKKLGADMVTFYMCYRSSLLALSLSPIFNRRTDRFGGNTMQERATLTLELFKKVRALCGEDFLIEMQMSAEEDQPGYTSEDWIEYCRLVEDYVDIVQIRATSCSNEHANGLNSTRDGEPPTLKFAQQLKEAGVKIKTAPITGFGDPDKIECYIREGRTDLVVMARRFLSESNYISKIENNQPEEIIPCLRCNECHGSSASCAVNPRVANWTVFPPPKGRKRVAVIGAGPAGMSAALIAQQRGHEVTLYEKEKQLGGQLKAACVPRFKWPIQDYLNFVRRKTEESDISIRAGICANKHLIEPEGYDTILCALGSSGKSIPVPGAQQDFVWLAEDVFGQEHRLGKRVAVVGGADTGRDTALHLAQCGHEVVMITRKQAKLFHDLHVQKAEERAFLSQENLSYIEHAAVLRIDEHQAELEIKKGIPKQLQGFVAMGIDVLGFRPSSLVPATMPAENSSVMVKDGVIAPRPYDESNATVVRETILYDNIVVSGGRQSRQAEAEQFSGLAPEYYVIGDNEHVGDIKSANASAYAIAMTL